MQRTTKTSSQKKHAEATINDFMAILKKIHFASDEVTASNHSEYKVTVDTLITGLGFVAVDDKLKQIICNILELDSFPQPQSNVSLSHYAKVDTETKKVSLGTEVALFFSNIMKYLKGDNFVVPDITDLSPLKLTQAIYTQLDTDITSVFDKDTKHSLIKNLATQLGDDEKRAKKVLLHGSSYSDISNVATQIAHSFEKQDYDVLHIDCSRYDGQTEKFVWCGSPPVWTGSNSGLLTEFVFRHPQSVVVLHNLEQANPEVTSCLTTALDQGYMIDEFGLQSDTDDSDIRRRDRKPTRVDFTNVIFIATSSCCDDVYEDKKFLSKLTENNAYAHKVLLDRLFTVKRQIRSNEVACYYAPVLHAFSKHMVMFANTAWEDLVSYKAKLFKADTKRLANKWDINKITLSTQASQTIAQVMLLNDQAMRQTTANWSEKVLASALDNNICSNQSIESLDIKIKAKAKKHITHMLSQLGDMPQASILKRSLSVEPIFELQGNTLYLVDCINTTIVHSEDISQDQVKIDIDYPDATLADVVGHEDAVDFLKDMVMYFDHHQHIINAGVDLPKGALLYGKPGTGKTHLARCFAGEAKVPLIAVSGTDLLQADNLNRLKALKKRYSPCAIFIDEADALKNRETSTLHASAINKLLPEIQGYDQDHDMVCFYILATNYPKHIDSALLRAGRIDKHFHIDTLASSSRAIFAKKFESYFDADMNIEKLVTLTEDFTGAQMQQLLQAVVLFSIKHKAKSICEHDFLQLIYDVLWGAENKNRALQPEYIKTIALHEMGHALVQHTLFPNQRISWISVRKNNASEGFIEVEDVQQIITKAVFKNKMAILLGGRTAELLINGEDNVSSGCSNDLKRASALAWHAIAESGMAPDISLFSSSDRDTPTDIALQARRHKVCENWLTEAEALALDILSSKKELLLYLTEQLITYEVINHEQFIQLKQNFTKETYHVAV